MKSALRRPIWGEVFSAAMLVSLLIFLFDLFTPREYSPWILYFIPILASSPFISTGRIFLLSGLCSVFTMVELLSGETPAFFLADLVNHLFAAVTYWIVAFLLKKQKDLVSDLESARNSLELRVKERTAELNEANRELESFNYSVSHDLRAPLRAIQGFTQIILQKQGQALDENTRKHFNIIQENTRRMDRLIHDLLDLSRLGRQALKIEPLDLAGMLEETWKEFQAANPDRIMSLKINPMPVASGDRGLMKQVVINLLSNAVKYTRTRDVAVIEAGGHEDEKEYVYYIRDNGVGFDMNYYEKLFGVFQRLHPESEYEGTGVGLAIVQRIVHRHGGRVWAEGKVGKGAAFYFSLLKKSPEG